MGKKGAYAGIAIAVVVIIVVFLYTNVFELAAPVVEDSVVTAKDAISQIEGDDVVKGAEDVSEAIQNETSKIEVQDPFE